MKIKLNEAEIEAFIALRRLVRKSATDTEEFFEFIQARLINIHKESECVDYMNKLDEWVSLFQRIAPILRK